MPEFRGPDGPRLTVNESDAPPEVLMLSVATQSVGGFAGVAVVSGAGGVEVALSSMFCHSSPLDCGCAASPVIWLAPALTPIG